LTIDDPELTLGETLVPDPRRRKSAAAAAMLALVTLVSP
jgi:hypothetical protein